MHVYVIIFILLYIYIYIYICVRLYETLTYSCKARDTCPEIPGISSSDCCRPLIIVGKIDLERSKSDANDCNRNAKNANDAKMLMGSKALEFVILLLLLYKIVTKRDKL